MRKHVFILPAIILLVFSAEITLAAGLSDTGQTRCYSNTAEIACPTEAEDFYGQDAQFSDPNVYVQQSFTKLNEDGSVWTEGDPENPQHVMVRDNVTGLIWEVKTDDGSIHDKDNSYTSATVQTEFIDKLNNPDENSGYGYQWRLPTIKELVSIVDYGKSNPFIDTDYFPNTNTISTYQQFSPYWSSSEYTTNEPYVLYFDFKQGETSSKKSSSSRPLGYVRAVRCEETIPNPTLIKNADDTVTDIKTGLTWYIPQTQTEPIGPILVRWSPALDYCKNIQVGAGDDMKTDWRMPNIRELASIVNLSKSNPAADTEFFPYILSGPFWSSTTKVDSPSAAYIIGFQFGTVNKKEKSVNLQDAYVIAVRGGEYGTFAAKADLNRDSRVNLSDAIIALQVCGGMEPAVDTTFGMANIDIDADLKIGMPEAIYILQEVAGIYRCL